MSEEGAQPLPASAASDFTRFVRDLTGLLALPAFWGGMDPAFVLRTLLEALETLLPVDACYGMAKSGAGDHVELLRVSGKPVPVPGGEWAPFVALARAEPTGELRADVVIGPLQRRCVRFPIGYAGEAGCIVLGSPMTSFPDTRELVTLHAALTLAATGLETARLIRERDEAQRAKDEFLAMLGHELRNPLAPIITSLRLMTMKAGGATSPEQAVIERQIGHLTSLVDDLLDIARVTKGTLELRVEPVDVADAIASAVETVAPLLEQRRHDVQVRVPRGLLISADPRRMTQVVGNLLSNAAKYTPAGGRVEVRAESSGGFVTIRVIDSGVGLSRELALRVFDVFVQGRQNLARSEGGLGIGLAIVKRLVQAHGGSVAARSDGPGRGSEFTVRLPALALSASPEPPPVAPAAASPATSAASILVVDDNHDAADTTAALLAIAGHRVQVAYSGLDAIEQMSAGAFDVLLLDIGLPDLDGYAVAAALRERGLTGSCHLIALTGYGQAHDQARSSLAGLSGHLVKPVDPAALIDLVGRLVAPP